MTEDHLRYTLHELPAGVLYGVDGATGAECDALLSELDEFRSLVAGEGRAAEYASLVAECDRHYRAYRQYLFENPPHRSYSRFLEDHGDDVAAR